MEVLCAEIAAEKDNEKFTELIQQLIDLLDRSRRAEVDLRASAGLLRRSPERGPVPGE